MSSHPACSRHAGGLTAACLTACCQPLQLQWAGCQLQHWTRVTCACTGCELPGADSRQQAVGFIQAFVLTPFCGLLCLLPSSCIAHRACMLLYETDHCTRRTALCSAAGIDLQDCFWGDLCSSTACGLLPAECVFQGPVSIRHLAAEMLQDGSSCWGVPVGGLSSKSSPGSDWYHELHARPVLSLRQSACRHASVDFRVLPIQCSTWDPSCGAPPLHCCL
jgi:hypothetical protein